MNKGGVSTSAIATTVANVFRLFRAWNDKVAGRNEVDTGPWKDQLGRFKLWCANLGAHQKATSSSLDARLRDAPHMREQVLRVLRALEADLEDLASLDEQHSDDEAISLSEHTDALAQEETEILESVNKAIDSLFQAAMYVRQSTNRPSILQIHHGDSHYFQPLFTSHLWEKFPLADEEIITRLAAVMTRRRSLLKYYEDHSKKLAAGIDLTVAGADEDLEAQTTLSPTLATKFIDISATTDSLRVPTAHDQEGSVYSVSLFQSSDRLTIPPRPLESRDGTPFDCPVCHRLEVINDDQTWARHLFQDIQPYSCILRSCVMPTAWYSSRRQWLAHIQQEHSPTLIAEQLQCTLCQEPVSDRPALSKHVCRHLEDLALFALPGYQDDSDSDLLLTLNVDDPAGDDSLDESIDDDEAAVTITRINDVEWEAHKTQFLNYYQQTTLGEAIHLMATNHNFLATEKQWVRKVKQWGLTNHALQTSLEKYVTQRNLAATSATENSQSQTSIHPFSIAEATDFATAVAPKADPHPNERAQPEDATKQRQRSTAAEESSSLRRDLGRPLLPQPKQRDRRPEEWLNTFDPRSDLPDPPGRVLSLWPGEQRSQYDQQRDQEDNAKQHDKGEKRKRRPDGDDMEAEPARTQAPVPRSSTLLQPPIPPASPFTRFTAFIIPQLEAEGCAPEQMNTRTRQEWDDLSAENREPWEALYNEQMREYRRGVNEYKLMRMMDEDDDDD